MLTEEIRKILLEELTGLKNRIGRNMARADEVVTGRTRDSMQVSIGDTYGVLTGRQAFATLETGSRPWSRQPKRVPRFFADLIGEWIKARGLNLNKWAVANTIIREGSKLYREGGRSDVYSPEIAHTMERIGDRVIERYAVLVSDRLIINNSTTIHV